MTEHNPPPMMDCTHPMCRVHLFFAGALGIAGIICIMTGALAQVGIVLLAIALAWGVITVLLRLYMGHQDKVVPYDETKEFTNMDHGITKVD